MIDFFYSRLTPTPTLNYKLYCIQLDHTAVLYTAGSYSCTAYSWIIQLYCIQLDHPAVLHTPGSYSCSAYTWIIQLYCIQLDHTAVLHTAGSYSCTAYSWIIQLYCIQLDHACGCQTVMGDDLESEDCLSPCNYTEYSSIKYSQGRVAEL